MLLLTHGFSMLAQSVRLLSYIQSWCLSAAGLVRKYLSPLKFLLQTVLIEFLELLQTVADAVGSWLFDLLCYL
jgi:hypothetical protein